VRRMIAVLVALAATAGCGGTKANPAAQAPASTATVEQGPLSAVVSLNGTLSYRARSDGSPYSVINQARGTYTALPEVGAMVGCRGVLYRVDDSPVLLLCGTTPAYRDVHEGDAGRDVRQLNRNLHLAGKAFTGRTKAALERLQRRTGLDATGKLELGDAVFLPRPVRIGKVAGELGGSARPGMQIAQATAEALHVRVDLDASQQGEVKKGDRAAVTLPGNRSAKGQVARLGRVAQAPQGKDAAAAAAATVPAFISLDHPRAARGLESAPVQVDVMTDGVESALSVPVTALVGKAGGGLAVELVRARGRRELVAVRVGLFDDAQGRVEVEGALRQGEHVVVPSS
jgi:multidrug efflux pump subunit AcrA (membrane-fusion protein)